MVMETATGLQPTYEELKRTRVETHPGPSDPFAAYL